MKVLLRLALLTHFVMIIPCNVFAAQYIYTGGVTQQITYDNNVFFQDEESFEYSINPSFSITRNTKRSKATLSPSISGYTYSNTNEFDRLNFAIAGDYSYQLTERLSSSTKGSFNASDALGFTLEEDGIVANDSRVYDYSLSQGFGYSLTKLDSLSFSYSFHPVLYEEEDFADSVGHSLSLGYGRSLSERSSISLSGGFSRTFFSETEGSNEFVDNKNSFTQDTYNLSTGYSYDLAEEWSLSVSAGLGASSKRDDDGLNYDVIGNANLNYNLRDERYSFAFGFDRSHRQSVLSENVLRNSVRGSFRYRLTEDLSLGLSASLAHSETSTGGSDLSTSFIPSMNFSYRFAENWRTGFTYSASEISTDRGDIDPRHRFGLFLTWNFKEQ